MLAEMMTTEDRVQIGDHVPTADQRIVIHHMDWARFEALLEARGDRCPPRMTYFKGAVELVSPSKFHEAIRLYFGRLLEIYFEVLGLDYIPYGSTLFKHPPDAGMEPDECYVIGLAPRDEYPDIALEVVWTSGGIAKLEVYRTLGVPEVWIWKDEQIGVYVLTATGYERRARSVLVPAVDLDFLLPFLQRVPGSSTMREFRAALAGHLPPAR
jgi:Uma2 family endonuclease